MSLPAGTVLTMNGQGSTGIVLEASPQADSAIGNGLTIHLTGTGEAYSNAGSTGVAAFGGSTATFRGLIVDGANASAGVVAYAGDPRPSGTANAGTSSSVTLSDSTITISRAGSSTFALTNSPGATLVTASGNGTPPLNYVTNSAPAGLRASPGSSATLQSRSTINAINTTINMNALNGFGVYAGARAVSGLNSVNLTGSTVNASAQGSSALGADQNGFVSATNSTVASTGASALYLITGVNVAGGVGQIGRAHV